MVPEAVRNVQDPEHRAVLNTLITLGLPGHLHENFHKSFIGMYLDPTEEDAIPRSTDEAAVEGTEQRRQSRQRFNRQAYDRMLSCRHVMAEFPPGGGAMRRGVGAPVLRCGPATIAGSSADEGAQRQGRGAEPHDAGHGYRGRGVDGQ